MNSSSLSFYSNVFGFIAGGISLLGFVVAVCRPHLPSNKIKTLENILHETEDTFNESVEAGLLVPESIERTEHRLTGLKGETCSLRARAYNATTLRRDFFEFFRGTSNEIGRVCQSVKKLQAEVITSSEERRRILMQMSSAPQVSPPALPPHPEVEYPPTPLPSTAIPRPHLCPPALPTSKPRGAQDPLVESNPFSDASRSDSDVRSADVQI